jgi:hypothetical protein
MLRLMGNLLKLIWCILTRLFRSRVALEAEIVTLRHQLNVLHRKAPKQLVFSNFDRFVFSSLYWYAPSILNALVIVKRETVASSRVSPVLAMEVALSGWQTENPTRNPQLIRDMSLASLLWGAPRIHGELLKLGIDVGKTSVAKYMARHRRPPSQGWKTFLRNHAEGIASMDLFVVPTISFWLLYGLLIL